MRGALKASVGEAVSSRALVFACAGRTADARELLHTVRGTTTAIEHVVLASAVDATCALRDGSEDVVEHAVTMENVAFATGAVDLLVTTYRSCPELLSILLRSAQGRRFRELVDRVGDDDLAMAVGQPIGFRDKRLLLSPRESEVYGLLEAGLTNRRDRQRCSSSRSPPSRRMRTTSTTSSAFARGTLLRFRRAGACRSGDVCH